MKKGLGASTALLILAGVAGLSMGVMIASQASQTKTVMVRHNQAMIFNSKMSNDHVGNMLNDTLWLSVHRGAVDAGGSNNLWVDGDIPGEGEIKDQIMSSIESEVSSYVDGIESKSGTPGEIPPIIRIRKTVNRVSINEEDLTVSAEFLTKSNLSSYSAVINDEFNFEKTFDLRYIYLYNKVKEKAGKVSDLSPTESVECSVSSCGTCPSRSSLRQKCVDNYEDELKDELNSISNVELSDFTAKNFEVTESCSYEETCSNCCNADSCVNPTCECLDYDECRTSSCGCEEMVNGTCEEYKECSSSACGCDRRASCSSCTHCGCDSYTRTSDGEMEGDTFTVNIELEDSESEVLTNNGYDNLEFKRKFKTDI